MYPMSTPHHDLMLQVIYPKPHKQHLSTVCRAAFCFLYITKDSGQSRSMAVNLVSFRNLWGNSSETREQRSRVWKCVCVAILSFCHCQQKKAFYVYQSFYTEGTLSLSLTRTHTHVYCCTFVQLWIKHFHRISPQ